MSEFVIRSQALNGFDETVVELGGDPQDFYRHLKIPNTEQLQKQEFIEYQLVIQLWNLAADWLACPHFGFLVALKKKPEKQYGILSVITSTSSNALEAIGSFARFLQIHTKTGLVTLQRDGDKTYLKNTILYPAADESLYQVYLHSIGLDVNILRVLSDNTVFPNAVHLMFREPPDSKLLKRALRFPIFFNADWNGLEFDTETLLRPMPHSNSELNRQLRQEVHDSFNESRHDFTLRLKNLIGHTLDIGDPSIDRVATYLACNKRTFQRRLDKWDLNFKRLLDEVRLHRAKHYLQYSTLSLMEVAELLNYNDQSSFSRFFTRCENKSPKKWRQEHRRD